MAMKYFNSGLICFVMKYLKQMNFCQHSKELYIAKISNLQEV